jgi:acyl carrier protein
MLTAYVAPNVGTKMEPHGLRSYLKAKLPDYMVPSVWVMLEALPLMPNGKVDRSALPVPDRIRPEPDISFRGPATPIENMIAAIWSELLGVEQVGVHDNFFDLGGHSLLAMRVISKIRKQLGVELPVRMVFEKPTVTGLAEAVIHHQIRAEKNEEAARILGEVEGLSEKEIRLYLTTASPERMNRNV